MRARGALLLSALAACAQAAPDGACPRWYYQSQFSYEVRPSETTPAGVRVDRGREKLSLKRIDRLVDQVERCLARTFGDPPVLPDDVRRDGQCATPAFALPVARACLVVKVPADWQRSCDGAGQVLPARAPEQLCRAKGLEPTESCPCRWRAGIQDDHVLVTTPDARLFKDPLVRLATGCNNPWGHPALAACAMPDDEEDDEHEAGDGEEQVR